MYKNKTKQTNKSICNKKNIRERIRVIPKISTRFLPFYNFIFLFSPPSSFPVRSYLFLFFYSILHFFYSSNSPFTSFSFYSFLLFESIYTCTCNFFSICSFFSHVFSRLSFILATVPFFLVMRYHLSLLSHFTHKHTHIYTYTYMQTYINISLSTAMQSTHKTKTIPNSCCGFISSAVSQFHPNSRTIFGRPLCYSCFLPFNLTHYGLPTPKALLKFVWTISSERRKNVRETRVQ